MRRRKTTRRVTHRRSSKSKLVGYTKAQGKYRLVYRKNNKLVLGKSKYGSKAALGKAVRKTI